MNLYIFHDHSLDCDTYGFDYFELEDGDEASLGLSKLLRLYIRCPPVFYQHVCPWCRPPQESTRGKAGRRRCLREVCVCGGRDGAQPNSLGRGFTVVSYPHIIAKPILPDMSVKEVLSLALIG